MKVAIGLQSGLVMTHASSEAPTHYPELNAVLRAFVDGARTALADNLVGIYLQGSFALGGFDTYSDVDFIAVLGRDVSDGELPRLQSLHAEIHELPSSWARHLEGSYLTSAVLRSFPPPRRSFWYLDNGASHLVRSDHDDSLVVYWTLREAGITLLGPPPKDLIDPVPRDLLSREIVETMSVWRAYYRANPGKLGNRFYQPYLVLSYCRMLHSLATGAIHPKPTSAAWARQHLAANWQALIDRADRARDADAAVRVVQPADPDDVDQTWLFLDHVVDLANRWASGAWGP